MRILYYDCFAGISGDMNLGALLDLGIAPDHLRRELAKLPLTGYTLDIPRASRNGISGTQVSVVLDPAPLPHRHLADIEAIITGSELAAEVQQSAWQCSATWPKRKPKSTAFRSKRSTFTKSARWMR